MLNMECYQKMHSTSPNAIAQSRIDTDCQTDFLVLPGGTDVRSTYDVMALSHNRSSLKPTRGNRVSRVCGRIFRAKDGKDTARSVCSYVT